jgi:hypothetical protein
MTRFLNLPDFAAGKLKFSLGNLGNIFFMSENMSSAYIVLNSVNLKQTLAITHCVPK